MRIVKGLFIPACLFVLTLAAPPATRAQDAHKSDVPVYKVDPNWPKQLPNNWIVGQIGGMAVDKDDHIWVLHRPRSLTPDEAAAAQVPPLASCCVPAPSV